MDPAANLLAALLIMAVIGVVMTTACIMWRAHAGRRLPSRFGAEHIRQAVRRSIAQEHLRRSEALPTTKDDSELEPRRQTSE
jgi:hypothetical protein